MSDNYRVASHRNRKDVLGAIEYIFKFMEQQVKIEIYIVDMPNIRFHGIIRGFDEWMNLVLEQTVEINIKTDTRKPLGRILLKGESISLMHILDPYSLR